MVAVDERINVTAQLELTALERSQVSPGLSPHLEITGKSSKHSGGVERVSRPVDEIGAGGANRFEMTA